MALFLYPPGHATLYYVHIFLVFPLTRIYSRYGAEPGRSGRFPAAFGRPPLRSGASRASRRGPPALGSRALACRTHHREKARPFRSLGSRRSFPWERGAHSAAVSAPPLGQLSELFSGGTDCRCRCQACCSVRIDGRGRAFRGTVGN